MGDILAAPVFTLTLLLHFAHRFTAFTESSQQSDFDHLLQQNEKFAGQHSQRRSVEGIYYLFETIYFNIIAHQTTATMEVKKKAEKKINDIKLMYCMLRCSTSIKRSVRKRLRQTYARPGFSKK